MNSVLEVDLALGTASKMMFYLLYLQQWYNFSAAMSRVSEYISIFHIG